MVIGAKVDQNYRLLVTTSGQITSISGDIVQISGQCIVTDSGSVTSISGNVVFITNLSGQNLSVSISGITVSLSGATLVTTVSGNPVTVSGNIVQISGQQVEINGQSVVTSVSGDIVQISGQSVIASITGDVTLAIPTLIRTGLTLPVTNLSGGVALSSGLTVSVVLKAAITNTGDIYVGGAGTNRPYSGFGYQLSQGEPISIDINNFNAVFIVAIVSGDQVSFMGND